jgi:hypothetical protein
MILCEITKEFVLCITENIAIYYYDYCLSASGLTKGNVIYLKADSQHAHDF